MRCWGRCFASTDYDARDIPAEGKRSITVGMGMTERQGGSDVRSNTTRAVALNPSGSLGPWGEEYLITGHKWFFSAPMCDGHLVLAKTEERGPTCFSCHAGDPTAARTPSISSASRTRWATAPTAAAKWSSTTPGAYS